MRNSWKEIAQAGLKKSGKYWKLEVWVPYLFLLFCQFWSSTRADTECDLGGPAGSSACEKTSSLYSLLVLSHFTLVMWCSWWSALPALCSFRFIQLLCLWFFLQYLGCFPRFLSVFIMSTKLRGVRTCNVRLCHQCAMISLYRERLLVTSSVHVYVKPLLKEDLFYGMWEVRQEVRCPSSQWKELWLKSSLCCHIASTWLACVLFSAFIVSLEHLSWYLVERK